MKKALMIVAMVGVIGLAGTAHAGTVYNYLGLGAEGAASVDPGVSNTDLLHNVIGVVTGQGKHPGVPTGGDIDVVTDGAYGDTHPFRFLPNDTTPGSGAVSTWTFTLGSPANIGDVRVYGSDNVVNNGPRTAYDYDLKFYDGSDVQIGSTITVVSGYDGTLDAAGSGTAHVRDNFYPDAGPPLPDFNQTHYTQVLDDTGVLAAGVSKVSFTFRPVRGDPYWDAGLATLASSIGYTWVTEIDVFEGHAVGGVIPEPAGLGLLGVALLAVRRNRS